MDRLNEYRQAIKQILTELGIPKQDIVLAYKSQFMRQYSGFAVE
ncbi:element excision factor XisI family protein [Scytonema sp. NUACC26]